MALSIRQQWSLRRIEYSLRRSDPGLAIICAGLGIVLLSAYAVQRCSTATRRFLDLNRAGLSEGMRGRAGSVDAS
jgi:hypothetical protein